MNRWVKFVISAVVALPAVDAAANAVEKPTYTQHVAQILNENCVNCHRPNDIAPMSLMSYEEVRPWVKSIAKNVQDGVMPPWHADPGYGPWKNERSLSEQEIDTIVRWASAGAPRGPLADMPPAPRFDDTGWRLGEPDLVLSLEPIEIPADGPDQFYNLEVPTGLTEDAWVTAMEIMPGDRAVVHHVIVWKKEQNAQGWLGAWAAGTDPARMPEGTGRLLKAGGSVIGDMHYHPSGKATTDQTKIGLHLAAEDEIQKELVNLWVMNDTFEILAGDPNYEARSTYTFAQDSHILSLAPHLHYRGKDFAYTITWPDETSKDLLKVSNYDFNWQTFYEFEEPVPAPKGTRIDCVAHWDNSADNPANPDPTKNVRFGPESYDEMMIGFVDYVVDEGVRPTALPSPIDSKLTELTAAYPGDVYTAVIPMNGKMEKTALHIPRDGSDGGWYVPFAGIAGKAPIVDIAWEGNAFSAVAQIPDGASDLEGTLNEESGTLMIKMTQPGGQSFPLQAQRAD